MIVFGVVAEDGLELGGFCLTTSQSAELSPTPQIQGSCLFVLWIMVFVLQHDQHQNKIILIIRDQLTLQKLKRNPEEDQLQL